LSPGHPNRKRRATPEMDNILKPARVTLRIAFIAISPSGTIKYVGDIGLLLRKRWRFSIYEKV
jgi:hypothetical protein